MTRAAMHTSKPNDKWTWEGIAKNADGPSPQRRGGGFALAFANPTDADSRKFPPLPRFAR